MHRRARKTPKTKAVRVNGDGGIRNQYAAKGVEAYYADEGKDYVNPHEGAVFGLLRNAVRQWPSIFTGKGRTLDLACGSGEAADALIRSGIPAHSMDACDPHTLEAFQLRFGKKAAKEVGLYDWSFEDIAGGILAGRRYSIVVCSFSLHLCDPSYLTTCCRSLAQSCANLVIITPHKRPEITEAMGWRLVSDIRDAEWRVRLRRYVSTEHTSLDPSSGDGVVKLETVWSFGAAEAASESRASASHEEIGITVDGASDEADAAADRQRRLDLLDRFCDDGSASAATGESGADGSVGTVGCGSEVDDGNGIDNSNDDEGDWETDDDGADVSAPAPVSSAAVSKANPSQRTVWGDLNLSGSQASVDLVAAKASLDKLIARRKIRDAAAEMQVAQAEVARLEAEAARALSAEKRREDEEAKRKANATKEREKRARAKAAEAKAAKAAKAAEKARTEKEARKQRELEERARIKQREKEAAAAEALRMAKRREIADRLKNAAGDFGRPSDAVTVVLDSGTAPLDMAARAAAMKAAIAARLGGSGPKSSMDLSARVAAKRAEIVERLASTPDGAASSR